MCDVNNHDPCGPGLTSVTEVRKCLLYILENIIIILCQCLYNILCATGSLMHPNAKAVNVNPPLPVDNNYCT